MTESYTVNISAGDQFMLTNPWERLSAKEVGSPPGVRIQIDSIYQAEIQPFQFLESPGSCRKENLDKPTGRPKAMKRSSGMGSGNRYTGKYIDRNYASTDGVENKDFAVDQSPTLLPSRPKLCRDLDSQAKDKQINQPNLKSADTQNSINNFAPIHEVEYPVNRSCSKRVGPGESKISPGVPPFKSIFNSHNKRFSGARRKGSPPASPNRFHIFTKFSRMNKDLVRNLPVANELDHRSQGYRHPFSRTFIFNDHANGRTK
jgi:hypothetical protein